MNKTIVAMVIIGLLCFSVGFGVGYGKGYTDALLWGIAKARYFVSVEINDTEIINAVTKYKNYINTHYPG